MHPNYFQAQRRPGRLTNGKPSGPFPKRPSRCPPRGVRGSQEGNAPRGGFRSPKRPVKETEAPIELAGSAAVIGSERDARLLAAVPGGASVASNCFLEGKQTQGGLRRCTPPQASALGPLSWREASSALKQRSSLIERLNLALFQSQAQRVGIPPQIERGPRLVDPAGRRSRRPKSCCEIHRGR